MLKAYLDHLEDLGARSQTTLRTSDFTLERMQALVAALGQPQQRYTSLHIAGTNGKGSLSAMCAAVLQAAGYRVGSFTSPHVAGALAGIRVDGEVVAEEALEASFRSLRPALDGRQDWTQFEVVTALAFQHFARAGVGAAVVEVGLGGRLDATNVITPTVSVITPIDLDHMSILGDSLAAIAGEKAGIIKPGVPAVSAPQAEEAAAVIRATAAERGSALVEVGREVQFELGTHDLTGQQVSVWETERPEARRHLRLGMLGAHQAANATTAWAALKVAERQGLAVGDEALAAGFAAARWPGRFEVLGERPRLMLDAAHSPQAARALADALEDYFPGQMVTLVLGVSADKDLAGILAPLQGQIAGMVATQSSHPRAMPAAELRQRLATLGLAAEAQPEAARALQRGRELAGEAGLVLACGSVFLAEQVRAAYLAGYPW